jgi:anti-sigma regulatory factor (Ser/Thr protein kinase)
MALVNRQRGLSEKDLEELINNALIVKPEYLQLPEIKGLEIDTKTYLIHATSESIGNFEDMIYADLIFYGMDKSSSRQFSDAIKEAVHNAADHVYKWDPEKTIKVEAIFTPAYDIVAVQSIGKEFDIDAARDRIKKTKEAIEKAQENPAEALKYMYETRGRGLYIMTECCHMVYPDRPYEKYTDMYLVRVKNQSPIVYIPDGKKKEDKEGLKT